MILRRFCSSQFLLSHNNTTTISSSSRRRLTPFFISHHKTIPQTPILSSQPSNKSQLDQYSFTSTSRRSGSWTNSISIRIFMCHYSISSLNWRAPSGFLAAAACFRCFLFFAFLAFILRFFSLASTHV